MTDRPTARRAPARGLLALALAGAAAAASLTPVAAAGAAPSAPLTRVVVSTVDGGVDGAAAAADAVRAAGGRVLDALPLVGGVAAELPTDAVLAPRYLVAPDRALSVAAKGGDRGDGPVSTARATIGLGAPAGEGAGVTIAVVDTGVADSPELADRLRHVDVAGDGTGDGYGHGTFVAGVAAASGAASGGKYAGIAPGADVLDVDVATTDGTTDLITVLRGLEVVAGSDVDVLNLSLSSYSPLPYQIDPLTVALEHLWARGVLVIVPSGNDGPERGTVTSPGVDPVLLTAGSVDEGLTAHRADDVVAEFSGRGPAPQGVAKPDLVAPGRSLVSLRAPGSAIDVANPTARVGDTYFKGSGTSFSTAVVAGAAATLLQERPDLTPDQLKALLTGSAYRSKGLGDVTAAGAGGLDLAAARTTATPDVPSQGPALGTGKGPRGGDFPGSPADWDRLLEAMLAEDQKAAASSWSRLSPEAKAWVASSWSTVSFDVRNWGVRNWGVRNWGGATAEEWAAREWAVRNWGVRNWGVRNWGVRNWGAGEWSVRNWGGSDWSVRNWGASSFSVRNWGADDWSVRNWGSERWSVRNWGAMGWSGRNWH